MEKKFIKEFKFIERDFLTRAKESLDKLKGALMGVLKGDTDEISVPVLDSLLELYLLEIKASWHRWHTKPLGSGWQHAGLKHADCSDPAPSAHRNWSVWVAGH